VSSYYKDLTERRGRVVNSCFVFGRSRVKISARRPVNVTEFSWLSSVHPGKFWNSTLKLDHYHFLPHYFKFIIHLSPFHSTLYNLSRRKKASLNKLKQTIYILDNRYCENIFITEVHNLYSSPNIIRHTKCKKMRWAGMWHAWMGREKCTKFWW
jgi:hypothetical protein